MNPLSSKTFVIVDNGIGVSFARSLVGQVGRVIYFCNIMTTVLQKQLAAIGTGFPGLERTEKLHAVRTEFRERKQDVLFVFLCVGMADLQEDLRDEGFNVFGAGDGEDLELCRWDARQLQGRLGLPMQPTELITGLDALRKYIQGHPEEIVKVSKYRGLGETFEAVSYPEVKTRLDAWQVELGPLADEQEFVVEKKIKTLREIGYDGLNVDGRFPDIGFAGVEIKNCGYVIAAVPYEDLPDEVRVVNDKLAPAFAAWKYRGWYSSEIRIGEDGKMYLIDSTCRAPSPPGELLQNMILNLAEVLWEAAQGRLVELKLKAKYGFQVALSSDWAQKHWQGVKYPLAIEDYVKLYETCRRHGLDWIVPGEDESAHLGYVTGFGDTIQEAMEQGMEHVKQVTGDRVEFKEDLIPALLEVLRESAKNGIHFGNSPIPDQIP
jgi:hypothetical protein